MNKPILRVLIVDDSEDDALLLERALKHGEWDISVSRVDGYESMKQALSNQKWDVVVSDFMIPSFGGMQALELFNTFHLNIPFILTSGKISEEMAVEALQEGAQDFVLKQNTARLLPAIKRGIERTQILGEQRKAHEALIQSENLFHTLAAVAPIGIVRTDSDCRFLYANETWQQMTGLAFSLEMPGDRFISILKAEDQQRFGAGVDALKMQTITQFRDEFQLTRPDNRILWLLIQIAPILELGQVVGYITTATDISQEKANEVRLIRQKELYQALSLTNQAIVYSDTPEVLFSSICQIAITQGKFCFIWIGSQDTQTQAMNIHVSADSNQNDIKDLKSLLHEKGETLLNQLKGEQELIFNDVDSADADFTICKELAQKHGSKSFANFSIGDNEHIKGVMTFCSEHKNFFDDEILGLLREIRGDINFALKNFEQLQWRANAQASLDSNAAKINELLIDTVTAIANTIEMRDPYTAGHQKRVALLACAIAQKMGLDAERIEGLNLAAQIHDVGKINIPAEILNKPTRLTDIEFMLIKTHPESGYEILKDIEFPWPVATIVRQHHEKLDGSGYPLNLKQDDILLESRILAVADIVEAMASHRPYRPSLGLEVALAEIIRLADANQLDKTTVIACISVFKDDNYQLLA